MNILGEKAGALERERGEEEREVQMAGKVNWAFFFQGSEEANTDCVHFDYLYRGRILESNVRRESVTVSSWYDVVSAGMKLVCDAFSFAFLCLFSFQ